MAVRISDCGTGSARDAATPSAGMTGGAPRVTPAAVKISTLDPLASSPRPTMICARRRRSIRYKPVAYSMPATTASTSSISVLGPRDVAQRKHDRQHDPDDREKDTEIEHEWSPDTERERPHANRRPRCGHERQAEQQRRHTASGCDQQPDTEERRGVNQECAS